MKQIMRVSLLSVLGLAQLMFGALLLWNSLSYSLSRILMFGHRISIYDADWLWFIAAPIAVAFAGGCQAAAGMLLLTRRWARLRDARRLQRFAVKSLVPAFLVGVAVVIRGAVAALGGDMYAGGLIVIGLSIIVVAAIFAAVALVAARLLPPAFGPECTAEPPSPSMGR
jgi:hypothetical protein